MLQISLLIHISSQGTSQARPGEWVWWDFWEIWVWSTHDTLRASLVKSWAVEGSVDWGSWKKIDEKRNTKHFEGIGTFTFEVSNAGEFRLIRLIQKGKNHYDQVQLILDGSSSSGDFRSKTSFDSALLSQPNFQRSGPPCSRGRRVCRIEMRASATGSLSGDRGVSAIIFEWNSCFSVIGDSAFVYWK
jgi:hypothetical protein